MISQGEGDHSSWSSQLPSADFSPSTSVRECSIASSEARECQSLVLFLFSSRRTKPHVGIQNANSIPSPTFLADTAGFGRCCLFAILTLAGRQFISMHKSAHIFCCVLHDTSKSIVIACSILLTNHTLLVASIETSLSRAYYTDAKN